MQANESDQLLHAQIMAFEQEYQMAYTSLIDCIFSKYSENQTVSVIDKNDQAIKQLL